MTDQESRTPSDIIGTWTVDLRIQVLVENMPEAVAQALVMNGVSMAVPVAQRVKQVALSSAPGSAGIVRLQ